MATRTQVLPRHRAIRLPGRLWLGVLLVGLVVAAALAWRTVTPAEAPVIVPPAAPVVKLTARGQVWPVAHARIGTLGGGVVRSLAVEVGDWLPEQGEIGRIRTPTGETEVLSAPWAGTITALPVNVGDTVTPGTLVAQIGDLSRYRIETTDVDEFIVASVHRGQPVTITLDALEDRAFDGYVRSVTLQPRATGAGDEHYPVIVELYAPTAEVRPGMTARITFAR